MIPALDVDKLLMQRLHRNDRIITISLIGMVFTIIALFGFVAYSNQLYQEQSRITGAKNHELTRQYIKCIATTLTKPLSERTPEAFNKCGIDIEGSVSKSPPPSTESNNNIIVTPQQLTPLPIKSSAVVTTTPSPSPSPQPTAPLTPTPTPIPDTSGNATGSVINLPPKDCGNAVVGVLGIICL